MKSGLDAISRYGTPLRYPGGKQKLTPFIREIIALNGLHGCHYAEPYAGGAGVAINLLLDGDVSHIHLNDACIGIYSFWRSILNETEEFCKRIATVILTVSEWKRQKEVLARPAEFSQLDVGFSLFYLNRVNRSGIVANGGLIGGLEQSGDWKMDVRFPKDELIRRVTAIGSKQRFVSVYNFDAERFITEHIPTLPDPLTYCDPPYFHKADRLYWNHYGKDDHAKIAKTIQQMRCPWIVSYDIAPEICKAYMDRRSFVYDLQYNAAKAYVGREVFFFADTLCLPEGSAILSIDRALRAHHRID